MARIVILGATSAIAEATARLYATAGHELCLVARNGERLALLSDDLATRGAARVVTLKSNLDDSAHHGEIIRYAHEQLGGFDIVLLAFGLLPDGERAYLEPELIRETFAVNTVSAITLLALAANELVAQGHGTLAAISSVAGDRGRQSNALYGASKAALDTFLAGLRNRVARAGVHVLTIKPGFVDTPMIAHLERGPLWASPEAVARGIVTAIERRRDVVYLPAYWRAIMFVVRNIPERIFKRLSL